MVDTNKEKDGEFFDHFAESKPTAIGERFHEKKVKAEFEYIRSFIQSTSLDILEIGPGKGDLAQLFFDAGYKQFDIVEPNSSMREKLQKMGARSAKSYYIPRLEEEDGSYDAIIVSDVFEHLNDTKEAMLFISEVKRVLRPNGKIFILSPDLMNWKIDFWNCDYSHSNPTSVRRSIQMFYNEDLEVVDYVYTYSFLRGFIGLIVNKIVRGATFFVMGNSMDSKLYKLRLMFSRRFLIVGKKPEVT